MTGISTVTTYLSSPALWTRVQKERALLGSVTAAVSSVAIHTLVTGSYALSGPAFVAVCAAPLSLCVLLPGSAIPFVLTALSSLSYGVGCSVAGAAMGSFSSIFLVKKLYFLIDYENPVELAQVRSVALKTSLPKLVERHGWSNLAKYQVVSPDEFLVKFRAHVDALPFRELLSFYKTASRACDGTVFKVLPPSDWKQKFIQETKTWDLSQIIATYALEDLSGIVTQTEIDALYRSHANTLSFKDLLTWYKKVSFECQGSPFTVPAPSEWKQKFIEETRVLTLDQILDAYPLKYLGDCLSQEDFEKMIRSHADTCAQFSKLAAWHDKVSRLSSGTPFKVPSLSLWKDKFALETEDWTCHQIVEVFHVPNLVGCVTERQYDILVQTKQKLDERNASLAKLKSNLDKAKEAHRAQRDALIRLAENRKTHHVVERERIENGRVLMQRSVATVTSTDYGSKFAAQDAYHALIQAAESTFKENKRLVKKAYEAEVAQLTALYKSH